MLSRVKQVYKFLKDIKSKKHLQGSIWFNHYYKKNTPLCNIALFEAYHGANISCNVLALLREFHCHSDGRNIKLVVASTSGNEKKIQKTLNYYNITNVKIVIIHTREYCETLTSCKWLVNNLTFPYYFIKKNGQMYLNTWHGTPLKTMGRRQKDDLHLIGNTQRNFLMCDYLLCANEHTRKIFQKDYMLDTLFTGEYITAGYPRNEVFYNADRREMVKTELGLEGKRVIAYMPTWRGNLSGIDKLRNLSYAYVTIDKLSRTLKEDEVLYIKLHQFVNAGINLSTFPNVFDFPEHIETYDLLNIADVLITDYSSVMFDFANRNKKIIVFAYDFADYLSHHGVYLELEDLPFSKVENFEQLIKEVSLRDEVDYNNIINTLSCYDKNKNSQAIVNLLLDKTHSDILQLHHQQYIARDKVILFAGALDKNGITTSFLNAVNALSTNGYSVYITFRANNVKNNVATIRGFGEEIKYLPMSGPISFDITDAFFLFLHFKLNLRFGFVINKLEDIYQREIKKFYPTLDFDHAVHFSGYERNAAMLFAKLGSKTNTIFVHNNIVKEIKQRKAIHFASLNYFYRNCTNVAVVAEQLISPMKKLGAPRENIHVVHNIHDHESVLRRARMNIAFDDNTKSNITEGTLIELLNNDKLIKFITIGRFSLEKRHDRLIKAFEKVAITNENVRLIFIGGYGKLYNMLLDNINASPFNDRIIIIRSLSNPHPILSACDLFILSSSHEGLPMVIKEALSLDVPVISTDIEGPREFLEKGYGLLVEESIEGLVGGMNAFLEGKIERQPIDWDIYNQEAKSELLQLFTVR